MSLKVIHSLVQVLDRKGEGWEGGLVWSEGEWVLTLHKDHVGIVSKIERWPLIVVGQQGETDDVQVKVEYSG
jgi:hypothetical protein